MMDPWPDPKHSSGGVAVATANPAIPVREALSSKGYDIMTDQRLKAAVEAYHNSRAIDFTEEGYMLDDVRRRYGILQELKAAATMVDLYAPDLLSEFDIDFDHVEEEDLLNVMEAGDDMNDSAYLVPREIFARFLENEFDNAGGNEDFIEKYGIYPHIDWEKTADEAAGLTFPTVRLRTDDYEIVLVR